MTQREKELLGRIYGAINRTSGLRARNPADIKTISRYHRDMGDLLRSINMAISCLGYGDLRDCAEELDHAESQLEKALVD